MAPPAGERSASPPSQREHIEDDDAVGHESARSASPSQLEEAEEGARTARPAAGHKRGGGDAQDEPAARRHR